MENWVLKNKKADFNLIMQECNVSEVIARCLVNRGLESTKEMKAFLYPELKELYDYSMMKDMKKATDLLVDRILSGKHIRIIGDYDVDGVISTYILFQTLSKLGAKVDYEIPDRIKDGYGINSRIVEAAHQDEVDTLLTCDNGIAAMEQVELAKSLQMTVVITDHHSLVQTPEGEIILPRADAIVNTKRIDCEYPFKGLCGAAIAYKLCISLVYQLNLEDGEEFLLELMSYVAIATVCDVMDLIEENRILVHHGLTLLKKTKNLGLLALMEASKIDVTQLSAFHLGFVIGPCLNASGRLDTAKKGLELLLSNTKEAAVTLATEVRALNDLRKDMTAQNVDKAIQLIENSELKNDKVLVVLLEDCHESIAGIIAGRIREKYSRPSIILTSGEHSIKGSGRSMEAYNMVAELQKCGELFIKMGGHPMAAGLSILPENVEVLRRVLNTNTTLTWEMLVPKVTIDIHLPLGFINEELVEELRLLEPFGKANEKPLFAEKDLKIKSAFIIGKNASGLRLRVENQYGRELDAVYFGNVNDFFEYIGNTYGSQEADKLKTGRGFSGTISVTYFPKINEYNGFRSIQLMIQNYR